MFASSIQGNCRSGVLHHMRTGNSTVQAYSRTRPTGGRGEGPGCPFSEENKTKVSGGNRFTAQCSLDDGRKMGACSDPWSGPAWGFVTDSHLGNNDSFWDQLGDKKTAVLWAGSHLQLHSFMQQSAWGRGSGTRPVLGEGGGWGAPVACCSLPPSSHLLIQVRHCYGLLSPLFSMFQLKNPNPNQERTIPFLTEGASRPDVRSEAGLLEVPVPKGEICTISGVWSQNCGSLAPTHLSRLIQQSSPASLRLRPLARLSSTGPGAVSSVWVVATEQGQGHSDLFQSLGRGGGRAAAPASPAGPASLSWATCSLWSDPGKSTAAEMVILHEQRAFTSCQCDLVPGSGLKWLKVESWSTAGGPSALEPWLHDWSFFLRLSVGGDCGLELS